MGVPSPFFKLVLHVIVPESSTLQVVDLPVVNELPVWAVGVLSVVEEDGHILRQPAVQTLVVQAQPGQRRARRGKPLAVLKSFIDKGVDLSSGEGEAISLEVVDPAEG